MSNSPITKTNKVVSVDGRTGAVTLADLYQSKDIAATPQTVDFSAIRDVVYLVDDSAGDVNITLPTSGSGFWIYITKTVDSVNKITFSENINGDANFSIGSQNSFVALFYTGTEYRVG